jgi:hypothetical protein
MQHFFALTWASRLLERLASPMSFRLFGLGVISMALLDREPFRRATGTVG